MLSHRIWYRTVDVCEAPELTCTVDLPDGLAQPASVVTVINRPLPGHTRRHDTRQDDKSSTAPQYMTVSSSESDESDVADGVQGYLL
jgi:hypothetical protein